MRDGATAEESELWRSLLSDAKFEATLRRTAHTILAKLLSAKALAEVLVNEAPAEEAEEAAAAAEEEATLRLPSEVERVLGQGAHGSGKGTLPAAWWGAAHDRALLTHMALHGTAITDAAWETLGGCAPFPAGAIKPAAAAKPSADDGKADGGDGGEAVVDVEAEAAAAAAGGGGGGDEGGGGA